MEIDHLDLETKLFSPTRALLNYVQNELTNLYLMLQTQFIDLHSTVASLGKEWYDQPIDTSINWYQSLVAYGTELYLLMIDELIPKVETRYDEIKLVANDFAINTLDSVNYAIDNPELVSAEVIESLTDSLIHAEKFSAEVVSDLQEKSSEIINLLIEQPIQTMESAYMDLLTSLLNGYFELVSSLLINA